MRTLFGRLYILYTNASEANRVAFLTFLISFVGLSIFGNVIYLLAESSPNMDTKYTGHMMVTRDIFLFTFAGYMFWHLAVKVYSICKQLPGRLPDLLFPHVVDIDISGQQYSYNDQPWWEEFESHPLYNRAVARVVGRGRLLQVAFSNEADAVEFKLKWGNASQS